MNTTNVWYITGASKGLGLALVRKVLARGGRVAATSRSTERLTQAIDWPDKSQFLPLEVDLTKEHSVKQSLEQTYATFGKLDVVVNNAGYGIGGAVEELSAAEIQRSFEINVFAPVRVMQASLPYLRQQRSGHIINISSIAGFAPATGWSVYAAAKYALMGLSEVSAQDLEELGVKVTVVAPGAFRTEFLSDESLVFSKKTIADYQSMRASHQKYGAMHGEQRGDPDKAAEVLMALADDPQAPTRLFLGSDAYERAKIKLEQMHQGLEEHQQWSFATDYTDS